MLGSALLSRAYAFVAYKVQVAAAEDELRSRPASAPPSMTYPTITQPAVARGTDTPPAPSVAAQPGQSTSPEAAEGDSGAGGQKDRRSTRPTKRSSADSSKDDESSTAVLLAWLQNHQDDPYPSAAEKDELARLSGLSYAQLSHWFINCEFLNPFLSGLRNFERI